MTETMPAIKLEAPSAMSPGNCCGELAGHPRLAVAAVLSDSQPGAAVAAVFPHLKSAYPDLKFVSLEEVEGVVRRTPRFALFCAAPHGVAAGLIDRLLNVSEQAGAQAHCVDISADFRYSSAAAYESVYKHAHGAPERIRQFTCAVPEHLLVAPTPARGAPGCFKPRPRCLRSCHCSQN